MPTLGERIRELRQSQALSQASLARAADISKGFLSDVENGKRDIGATSLLRIADALGTSLDHLMRGKRMPSDSVATPIEIPLTLSAAAREAGWSYDETLMLLEAYNAVSSHRPKLAKEFDRNDWRKFYKNIIRSFG